MKVKLNGISKELEQSISIQNLLNLESSLPEYFVLALNFNCIPQENYDSTLLSDGDEIEIVSPMQGG